MSSKPFFIVLLICLTLVRAFAYSIEEEKYLEDMNYCSNPFDSNLIDINKINSSGCKTDDPGYCNCLAQTAAKSDIISTLSEQGRKKAADDLKELKNDYRKRWMNVYSQLTFGSALQEEIYGITRKAEVVGCTSSDIGNTVSSEVASVDIDKSLAIKVDTNLLTTCGDNCNAEVGRVNAYYETYKKTVKYDDCVKIREEKRKNPRAKVTTNPKRTTGSSFIDYIKKLFSLTGLASPEAQQLLTRDFSTLTDLEHCVLTKEFYFKSKFARNDVRDNKRDDVGEEIKNELDRRTDEAKNQIKKDYSFLPNEESCVLYKDYKVIAATPTADLIAGLSSSTGDYLDPSKIKQSNSHQMKFLKNNPTLAALAANPTTRARLTDELRKFAKSNQGKSKVDVQREYGNFLRELVPRLKNSNELKVIDQCQLLGENLAKIEVANSLPPLPIKNDNGTNPDVISNNLMACYVNAEKSDVALSSIDDNPLYLMLSEQGPRDESKGGILGPENDDDYKQFIAENCTNKNWVEFREKFIKERCKGGLFKFRISPQRCRDLHFREDRGRTRMMIEKFYAESNPELLEQYKLATVNTHKPDNEKVVNTVNEKYQNHDAKNVYNNEVLPNLNRDLHTPASSGNGNSVASSEAAADDKFLNNAQAQYNTSAGGSQAGGRVPASVADGNDQANGKSNSVTTPNWVQDLPTPSSAINPATIQSAKSVEDLMDKDPNKSFEDRAEEREEIRDQIQETRKLLSDMGGEQREALKDKLDGFEQQLKEADAKDDEARKDQGVKPSDTPAPAYAAQQYGATPEAFAQQTALGGGSYGAFGGGGGGGSTTGNAKANSEASYNAAVLAMYDSRKEVITPSGLVVQNIPANPDTLTLALKTELRNTFSPTAEEYKKLKTQEDLATFLFQKLEQPYQEGVVKINVPNEPKKPIYIQILKDKGKFTARIYPRKWKLNQLEEITGQK